MINGSARAKETAYDRIMSKDSGLHMPLTMQKEMHLLDNKIRLLNQYPRGLFRRHISPAKT
jgi:hypothetical protein